MRAIYKIPFARMAASYREKYFLTANFFVLRVNHWLK